MEYIMGLTMRKYGGVADSNMLGVNNFAGAHINGNANTVIG
jgi:hypothetical protein